MRQRCNGDRQSCLAAGVRDEEANIPARSEGTDLFPTDARLLVQIGLLLKLDSTKVGKAASGNIDTFPKSPFNFLVLNRTMTYFPWQRNNELPQPSILPQP